VLWLPIERLLLAEDYLLAQPVERFLWRMPIPNFHFSAAKNDPQQKFGF
jgi:hypothetical protein